MHQFLIALKRKYLDASEYQDHEYDHKIAIEFWGSGLGLGFGLGLGYWFLELHPGYTG